MIPFKYIAMILRARRLLRKSIEGDVTKIVEEVFKDAPEDVKNIVGLILSTEISNRDPKDVATEIGMKLGLKGEDLVDFVDTVLRIAEEVREFIKAESK